MATEKHHKNTSEDPAREPPVKSGQSGEEIALQLPQVDTEMLSSVPPELSKAWAEYMINGFTNNQRMFEHTLNAFMKPYNITIYMYVVMFVVGILFFVVAVVFGFLGDQPLLAIGFGGLSVISFVTFFIRQPVQALEENLEFISWLGVAFNTYWTRLMYISNNETVQVELQAATDDYSKMVERLIEKHAKLRGKRPGKELVEAEKTDNALQTVDVQSIPK